RDQVHGPRERTPRLPQAGAAPAHIRAEVPDDRRRADDRRADRHLRLLPRPRGRQRDGRLARPAGPPDPALARAPAPPARRLPPEPVAPLPAGRSAILVGGWRPRNGRRPVSGTAWRPRSSDASGAA